MAIKHGYGTTITWAGGAVAKLLSVGGVSVTTNSIDVTTHDSASRFMEFIAGMNDAGEVALEGLFDPADTDGQVAMFTDMSAGTVRECVITFPSTIATWTFNAFATSYSLGTATTDGALPFSATLKITGVPVLAVTAVTGMSAIGFSNDVLMMPTFAIGRYGEENPYVVTITAGQTSTVITPVDATSGEIITITTDGGSSQVVATGEASSACVLDVDDVTIIRVTISKANYASKVYVFNCAVLAG